MPIVGSIVGHSVSRLTYFVHLAHPKRYRLSTPVGQEAVAFSLLAKDLL